MANVIQPQGGTVLTHHRQHSRSVNSTYKNKWLWKKQNKKQSFCFWSHANLCQTNQSKCTAYLTNHTLVSYLDNAQFSITFVWGQERQCVASPFWLYITRCLGHMTGTHDKECKTSNQGDKSIVYHSFGIFFTNFVVEYLQKPERQPPSCYW